MSLTICVVVVVLNNHKEFRKIKSTSPSRTLFTETPCDRCEKKSVMERLCSLSSGDHVQATKGCIFALKMKIFTYLIL